MVGIIHSQASTSSFDSAFESSPDDLIARRIRHAFRELQVPILSTLSVEVNHGAVTLRGRVRNYYERQLAYVHAKRVAGAGNVTEEIGVAHGAGGLTLWQRPIAAAG